MSSFDDELRKFPTLAPPGDGWERLRRRAEPHRFRFRKESLMVAAAMIAVLGYLLGHAPAPAPRPAPMQPAGQDTAWLEREPSLEDLAPQDRTVVEALVGDLGTGSGSRRDAAAQLLEARLEVAIPVLRKAVQSDNPELKARAKALLDTWEQARQRRSLTDLLARARAEGQPKEEWKELARKVVAGDEPALREASAAGWAIAPLVADLGAGASGRDQIRLRAFLKDLLLPLTHPRSTFLLTRKQAQADYGTSAASFRYATSNPQKCKNMIDVVYNNCGLLHFTPYGSTASFVADAGEGSLEQLRELPTQGWHRANCLLPKNGHSYALEIREDGVSYTFKFHVIDLSSESVTLEWSGIGESRTPKPISPLQGGAGVFPLCGGRHNEY
jgi:hypothetical protein